MQIKKILKRFIPATYKKVDEKIDTLQKPLIDFIRYSEILYEARKVHEETFPKYKNFLKGENVAIIGCGPTLDKWTPFDNCIQMGVNSSILSEKLKLDYCFVQDYEASFVQRLKQVLKEEKNSNCKLFIGLHYLDYIKSFPLYEIEALNAEQYFFYDCLKTDFFPWDFSLDISEKPFILYYSSIFIPLQFALYAHPKKIFVVGCDCSSDGHYSGNFTSNFFMTGKLCQKIINGWEKFKKFASRFYPDIEIISINPIGLKGLFHDMYTEEYLMEHPEINRNGIEIINKVND